MRLLEKLSLIIFSLIILILSVIICMLTLGWLNVSTVNIVLLNALSNPTASNVILGVAIVCILLAIKNIFFSSNSKEDKIFNDGVLLQNDNGKLLISKETLENLVSGIAKGFEGTKNVTTRVILDKENNLSVQVTLFVEENAIIKDLSSKLQIRIKEAIKDTSDLEVKEVNIQVKNIAPQELTIPEK